MVKRHCLAILIYLIISASATSSAQGDDMVSVVGADGNDSVSAEGAEVPFVFGDDCISISDYSSDDLEKISASSTDLNGVPKNISSERWGYQGMFDAKVEPNNLIVRQEVAKLDAHHSGYPSIDQICSIFNYYIKGDDSTLGWHYINDPRGINSAYANESLQLGEKTGNSGAGDCDDFAIVMSSLVESIGGTSRIVRGTNPDEAHVFTEVFLGRDNGENSPVPSIIYWLMQELVAGECY